MPQHTTQDLTLSYYRASLPWLLCALLSCDMAPDAPVAPLPPQGGGAGGAPEGYAGAYPRFPHDARARALRDVLVFYSPDDIFSAIDWEDIGYPEEGFFKIHKAFPKLKITLQTVPENRYLGDIPNRNIENDPVAAQVWRDLFGKDEFRSWLEFGNHGYFHSPEGDPDLDHHEFDARVNPAASDSAFCYGTFARARSTYAALGLDNDRITVMRFPGHAYTPMALRALVDHGFLGFFAPPGPGPEAYVDLGDGREILSIPTIPLDALFGTQALAEGLRNGDIDASDFEASPIYRDVLAEALARVDRLIRAGGVLNLFDHWWEYSREDINGAAYRFSLFRDLLRGLDGAYGERVWWGFGSELALWSHLKRNAPVELAWDEAGISVAFGQPAGWKAGWTLTASYSLVRVGSSSFPPPGSIRYTLESEGHARTHELDPEMYWVEGNALHFNVPYSGALEVRIALAEAPGPGG